jgi:hypothetical protein
VLRDFQKPTKVLSAKTNPGPDIAKLSPAAGGVNAKPKIMEHGVTPASIVKQNATVAQRIEVLDWYHENGKSQRKTEMHFRDIYPELKIKQPLVSKWLKQEVHWRGEWERAGITGQRNAKRARQTQHPDIEEMMDLWVTKAMADGIVLTGEVLRQKWKHFADLVGIPDDERLTLSEGWLTRFKTRHGLKEFKRHGEAGSVNPEIVQMERMRIQELVEQHGYEARDIFNMDETGLFYAYV